ncbi:MAG TPA: polysaccharide deacetylase family protein, partial [Gemmatimonadales bacterium]|nr:polysaccharide deacetylase family protein [Gemmatimonadales bacterium]
MTRGTPVFLDSLGLRAKAVNVGLALSCLALALAVLAVATGVLFAPNLPPLPSPAAAPLEDAASPLYGRRKEVALVPTRNRQVPSGASGALRLAYLSLDHPASFASLRNNAVYLDGIIPNWLKFARENGRAVVRIDKRSEEVARWLRARAPHLAIYPQLSTALGASETVAAITNPASRASLVQQVLEHIAATGSHGVVVSLADLPSSSARGITAFIAELGAAVRGAGGKLLVAAMVGDGSNRLQELARLSDFIIAETHDRASTGDDDVAPAGQGWFEKEIWSDLSVVPPQKLIARVGAYATDIDEYGTRRIRSVQTAWDIASKSGSRIVLDPASLNSFFVYRDEMKRQHKVWILDAVSGFNQTKSALAAGTAGVALSSLGLEDPGVWSFLQRGRVPDEAAIKALSDMEPGPGGFGEARGVLIAASPGLKGSRLLTPSTLSSLITQQEIRAIPGRDRAKTWPAVDPKALAITFDDGPDQEYTPKILDVLAEKNVRATFYILGRNAVASPEIMERMYREGHDIGNHSYSHANLFMAAADRIAVEFNATQRVMEAQLGVTSLLVRPPYAYDGYFYLDSSPDLVRTIHDLGYVVGGIDVDGFDYLASAELIRERVVTQILEGEGQVILLHDSGGNRRATIAALPRIIDDLRSAGYRFVTTHELAGLSRAQVMPPERGQGLVAGAEAGIRRAAIRIGNSLAEIWPSIAIGTAALGVLRFALIVLAALTRRTPKRTRPSTGPSAIAVIVPAYNEEAVIATTVRSLLGSSISERLEILVVDDGSKDRTAEVVRGAFGHDARVRLLCQANGGKAA